MPLPLISLENVDVAVDGTSILRGIDWCLWPGEHWAILGANGSGKSTLLRLVRGELWPAPGRGRRVYAFDGDEQTTAVGIKERIALVSPELQQWYAQREWRLTALQVIHSGFQGEDYAYQTLTATQRRRAESIIRLLGIGALRRRYAEELSTGELRKILIARALVGAPRVLICDEICDGLDATARAGLLRLLERVARNGTQLLYATHRAEEIVPSITHRLILQCGRIVGRSGEASRQVTAAGQQVRKPAGRNSPLPAFRLSRLRPFPALHPKQRNGRFRSKPRRALIRIEGASVFLGRKRVLREIHLEISAGQHWAIVGPNGAGKSTLLKLMFGDVHPAMGGRVERFDFTPANTIWEVKQRVGHVSPELQANYREALTGAEVIASGFFSSVGLMRRPSRQQMQKAWALASRLRLRVVATKDTRRMSYGEFRQILLARALVHRPEMLLCDEPFDGLDGSARAAYARTLERAAEGGTTLVVVTHHPDDLPPCITHAAELKDGRLVFQGTMDEYLNWKHRSG
jgi:molybdate transport system ATP-binding protein